jgi:rSAM/selenodomain-associated transferase 1
VTITGVDVPLLVIAKAPVPGRVKTRLCPPCTPNEAARLAGDALADTLAAVSSTPATRRVLVFEGDPVGWCPPGWETIPQRGDGLGARLEAAFADVGGRGLLVGMDTPQLWPADLGAALARLSEPDTDAVIAPTYDGGYWCIGFSAPCPGAFAGVPMSTHQTYRRQRARLQAVGARVAVERRLRDVDTIADAYQVAAQAPCSRFARSLADLDGRAA